jgi:hypothetical protein
MRRGDTGRLDFTVSGRKRGLHSIA